MTDLREDSFGLFIAYVVPGFLCVLQLSAFSQSLADWLALSVDKAPTIAGFLYASTISIGAGLTASAVRWLAIDSLHHWTGLRQPRWSFAELQGDTTGFMSVVQNHYRYYQFYALWRARHNEYYAYRAIMRSWAARLS